MRYNILFLSIFYSLFLCSNNQVPAKIVESLSVQEEELKVSISLIGEISAQGYTVLKPQDSGIVEKILVKSSQKVKKGEILLILQNKTEQSSLELSKKKLELAKLELERLQKLFAKKDIASNMLDQAKKELLAAQSAYETSQKSLSYTQVKAPFDAEIGIFMVSVGQHVDTSSALITLWQKPLLLKIKIPALYLPKVNAKQEVIFKNQTLKLDEVQKVLDPLSKTGLAQVNNLSCEDCIIGASEKVSIVLLNKRAIMVPKFAVYSQEKSYFVKIINDNNTIEDRLVEIGVEQDGKFEIISGLKTFEKIVKYNPLRVRNNEVVKVLNK